MSRPRLLDSAKDRISLRLSPHQIQRALSTFAGLRPGSLDMPSVDASTAIATAALAGIAAIERSQRIGADGHELGSFDDGNGTRGIEVLFRASTPHGARVLSELIKIYEATMQTDLREPQSGGPHERPTQDWRVALAEIRALVEAHGGTETVLIDANDRPAHIQFFPSDTEIQ